MQPTVDIRFAHLCRVELMHAIYMSAHEAVLVWNNSFHAPCLHGGLHNFETRESRSYLKMSTEPAERATNNSTHTAATSTHR